MPTRAKRQEPRSEMRTVRDCNDHNYIVIRFWDDSNNNWEYHVYGEVVAKEAAREVAKKLGVILPPSSTHNVRQFWNIIWDEKLTY